ncbi:hypothetical protein BLL52_4172 [Rhodoferax antarcticus ANT.BR]|uniref:Uncharacterized protein n=2 Tax=Rhodoferax antarcticus TaxID=81479 RepID=A0A1Q8Y8W2_9BURK|nr:hypothetical protein BLL52_4172 [Rhodoferax antarcticus ANT.BR]
MLLYAQHKAKYIKKHPEDSGVGLDLAFAVRLQIAKSSLSSMKSGSRQIGVKLARQFEANFNMPSGWMDEPRLEPVVPKDTDLMRFLKLSMRAYEAADQDRRQAMISELQDELSCHL